MNRRELIIEVIPENSAVLVTGTNDPRVVEIVTRGKKGEKGDDGSPGIGSFLMEADEDTPPTDTPTGTIIYQKG